MFELNKYEKANIIQDYIKDCVSLIYAINLKIIAEGALENPNIDIINDLNKELKNENAKKSILLEEYGKLGIGE